MVVGRLELHVIGQASKRGLIPRTPAPERLLADMDEWLRREYPDELRSSDLRDRVLTAELHPAAPPVSIAVDEAGQVRVSGETAPGGPGYHRFVGRVIDRLGDEVGISWAAETVGLAFAERPDVERAYLTWLGPQLARARESRRRGARPVHLGTRPGVHYHVDGALLTALGPRDDAWLESAIADPRVAIEITPWWLDATDGHYLRNRALALMWEEVRWRAPAIDSEKAILDEVHRCLSRAYPIDPDLDYPWREWSEIIAARGITDAMSRGVFARLAREPGLQAVIGYRRAPVTISHEGWALTIPGEFAERRTAEEWWGASTGKTITLAATATGTDGGGRLTAQGFLGQVASDLGTDALHHEAGDVRGRARLSTDASSGLEVGVLDGFSAVTGSGAAIRITFDDADDYAWALETWRSLAPG